MNPITRTLAMPLLAIALQPAFAAQAAQPAKPGSAAVAAHTASTITTADGVQLYYKDWGPKDGPVVTFSHGWPLSSDSWESQMLFLASEGYRVVAHDRRGHGRSSQVADGHDMDHYAADAEAVVGGYAFSATLAIQDITGLATSGVSAAHIAKRLEPSAESEAYLFALVDNEALRPVTELGFPELTPADVDAVHAWVFISVPLLEDRQVLEANVTLAAELAPLKAQLPTLEWLVTVEPLGAPVPWPAVDFDALLAEGDASAGLPLPRGEQLAVLGYTSGTTGRSKGAMLLHRNLLANVRAVTEACASMVRCGTAGWWMPRADCATYDSAITEARARCSRAVASSMSSSGPYPQIGASIASRPARRRGRRRCGSAAGTARRAAGRCRTHRRPAAPTRRRR